MYCNYNNDFGFVRILGTNFSFIFKLSLLYLIEKNIKNMFQSLNYIPTLNHLNKLKHQEQTQKNKKRSLRSPVIFYEICSFLDNETIFECKYVKIN